MTALVNIQMNLTIFLDTEFLRLGILENRKIWEEKEKG